jgi:hypothetical protein
MRREFLILSVLSFFFTLLDAFCCRYLTLLQARCSLLLSMAPRSTKATALRLFYGIFRQKFQTLVNFLSLLTKMTAFAVLS